MKKIKFSKNWNNKLDCDYYTTIRVWNPNKYQVNENYEIILNDKIKHVATIVDVKKIFFKDINNWISRLDAGLTEQEFKAMMCKMYQAKATKPMEEIAFAWVLLKRNNIF